MKKITNYFSATMLSVMVTGSLLVGCGGSSGTDSVAESTAVGSVQTDSTKNSTAESLDNTTLRFAWWGGDSRHEATLEAIAKYEELNPGIKIEAEYQGYDGYYEKLITTLSSGTAPDIMQFHRDWIADIQGAKHYLADLSLLPVDTGTLAAGVLERSGTYNNEPVLYSCTVGGQTLYVNMDFAARHSLDLDKTYTWEEFMAEGKRIHDENPEEYLLAADIDVLNRLLILQHLAQSTGGSIINEDYTLNFTEEQMTESLQLIIDMYKTGTLEPFGESAVFVGQMEQNTKWVQGKIGLLLDFTTAAAKYKASVESDIDVIPIPQRADAVCSGVDYAGNMGIAINDNSKYKEEAAKFLNWMMNDEEAIKILKDSRGFPATSTAVKTLETEGLMEPILKKASEIASVNAYSINAISANTELEIIRKDIIQEVIYEDITPEEGAKNMVEYYQEFLSEFK